jgi:hypothetical protein
VKNDCTSLLDVRPLGDPCESTHVVGGFLQALGTWRALARRVSASHVEAVVFVERARGHVEVAATLQLPLDRPTALVVGSHPCADIVLGPDVSLRHAAVLVWPHESEGAPEIEVLDLRTSTGIGRGARSVSGLLADGAVQFTVGTTRLTIVALAPHESAPHYPDELDRRITRARVQEVVGLDDIRRDRDQHRGRMSRRLDDRDRRALTGVSVVTTASPFAKRNPSTGFAHGTPHSLVVDATEEDWANGIVVGRDARCTGASMAQNTNISRVHALLLARRGRLFVVDTGSTNGTTVVDSDTGFARAYLCEGDRMAALAPADDVIIWTSRVVVRMPNVT